MARAGDIETRLKEGLYIVLLYLLTGPGLLQFRYMKESVLFLSREFSVLWQMYQYWLRVLHQRCRVQDRFFYSLLTS
jgi:hypothetical protein